MVAPKVFRRPDLDCPLVKKNEKGQEIFELKQKTTCFSSI